ncbi:hypothetical protein SprV_0602141800 [Sparganum proliferum]
MKRTKFIWLRETYALIIHSGAPSEVRNLRAAPATSNSLSVAWDPPLQTGGVLDIYLMHIQYEVKGAPKVTRTIQFSPLKTNISVLGLPNDCEIEVQMQARTRSHIRGRNSVAGRRSEVFRVKTFADPAQLNWTVTVVPTNESTLWFEWSPPLSGAEELQRIELKSSAIIDGRKMDRIETVDSTARKFLLGGLLPGRTYDTVVVAVLTWSPPMHPGGELAEYLISLTYNEDGTTLTRSPRISAKSTTYLAWRLPADCDIYAKIQASTKSHVAGADQLRGNWSDVLHLRTFADPTHSNWAVDVVTVNESTLQFEWSPPLSEVDEILLIELKATATIDGRDMNFKNDFAHTARMGFLGGLLPGRTYSTLLVVEYPDRNLEMYTGRQSTKDQSPSAVRNLRTENVTSHSISLTWEPPMQPGGYLDKYQLSVQYEERDGSKFEALRYISPELTAYVVDQLPADRVINVKIQSNTKSTVPAEDTLAGPWSKTIRVKTSADPLDLSSVDVVPITENSLQFNWSNWIFPTDGLQWFELKAIDSSDAKASNYSVNVTSSKRTGILEGLIPDRTYETVIVAVYSNRSTQQYTGLHEVPAGVHNAQISVTAEAINSTAIQISWRSPHNMNRRLDHYRIFLSYYGDYGEVGLKDMAIGPSRNNCIVNNLPPATDIEVTIAAVVRLENQGGMTEEGKWSKEVIVTTLPATFEVHNFAVEALNSSAIRLSWDPPSEHSADILGYVVNLQVDGTNDTRSNASHHFPSGEYTHVIGELPADREINVKAQIISRSRMQRGETVAGNWSEVLQTKTYAVPSAPLNVTAEAIDSNAIQISWRPPHNIDRKLYHYWVLIMYYEYDGGQKFEGFRVEPSRNSCVVSDLPPATDIEVMISLEVKLENQDGVIEQGTRSDEVTVTTHPATFEVHNFAVEALNSSAIRLSWDPPSEHSEDILGYVANLQVDGTNDSRSNASHHFPSGEYTHVIGELPADREINVKAQIISRSRMQRGETVAGNWSEVLQTKTYAVPSAPLDVTAEAINSTAIHITWRPPPNIDRKLVYYSMFITYYGHNGDYQYKYFKMEPSTNSFIANDLPPATKLNVVLASRVRLEKKDGLIEQGGWSKKATVTTHTDELTNNLSSKQLTEQQLRVLQHETCFDTADADPVDFISALEAMLVRSETSDDMNHPVRQRVTSLLMTHRPTKCISQKESKAMRELKRDDSIIILPADKGRLTVVMNREDCNEKAEALLDDREFYRPAQNSQAKAVADRLSKLLREYRHKNVITEKEWHQMRATDTALARFYGLPKIHKEKCPTSANRCPKRQPHLQFDKVDVHKTEVFPRWPAKSCARLEEAYDETQNALKIEHLMRLFEFCQQTFFTFAGETYEQIKGTPMGSPVSGLVAKLVLQELEKIAFLQHEPVFWRRYNGDMFVVVKKDMLQHFHSLLNAVFPDIKFTREEEQEQQLPFLDVLVKRNLNNGP